MKDFYQQNPEELKGQPKKTIADYVESQGISVPKRFNSLKEARKSHKAIILRSEHTQDYDGVSGLLKSYKLSDKQEIGLPPNCFGPRGISTINEVKKEWIKFIEKYKTYKQIKSYCELLEYDEKQFKEEVSFSIWERIGGYERKIIADSSIANRHHITTYFRDNKSHFNNYAVVESGEIIKEYLTPLTKELRKGMNHLIGMYESVRRLENFDSNHCPIVEAKTLDGKNYFLQYHISRDFKEVDFVINRKPTKKEFEVSFVRGATSKEGMDCKVTIFYAERRGKGWGPIDTKEEDGSYDLHHSRVFSEVNVRKRKIQLEDCDKNGTLESIFRKLLDGHLEFSKLFKPEVSVINKLDYLISESEFSMAARISMEESKNQYIDLHVISDGRKAYIKRI